MALAETERILSLSEAATATGVPYWTLDSWIATGKLPAIRFNARGKRYVRPNDLARVVAKEARPA